MSWYIGQFMGNHIVNPRAAVKIEFATLPEKKPQPEPETEIKDDENEQGKAVPGTTR